MAIRAPDGAKNSHILPTGQWYAPSAVNYSALSCTFLHSLALSCTMLHYLELSCTILHYLALSCTILHYLALSCFEANPTLIESFIDKCPNRCFRRSTSASWFAHMLWGGSLVSHLGGMMWDNILRRLFLLPFVTRAATDTYDCCQEVQLTGETIKSVPNKITDFVSQYLLIF